MNATDKLFVARCCYCGKDVFRFQNYRTYTDEDGRKVYIHSDSISIMGPDCLPKSGINPRMVSYPQD